MFGLNRFCIWAIATLVLSTSIGSGQAPGDLQQQQRTLEADLRRIEKAAAALQSRGEAFQKESAQFNERAARFTAKDNEIKSQAQQLDMEIAFVNARDQKLSEQVRQINAETQKLKQEGARLKANDEAIGHEGSALKADSHALDKTNRYAVNNFNAKVNAYNAKLQANKQQIAAYNGAAGKLQQDIAAYNAQVKQLADLRRALQAKLRELNMANAKNHAEGAELKRTAQNLEQRRTDINVARNRLLQEQKDWQARSTAFKANAAKAKETIEFDDNARKARDGARQAEEERKRLEKQFDRKPPIHESKQLPGPKVSQVNTSDSMQDRRQSSDGDLPGAKPAPGLWYRVTFSERYLVKDGLWSRWQPAGSFENPSREVVQDQARNWLESDPYKSANGQAISRAASPTVPFRP